LLNTPELTGEEREELEALQREFEAANNQHFSGSFGGGGGSGRPDDTFPTRVEE
jgi:hypothetical protein